MGVFGESMGWKQTSIGAAIGAQPSAGIRLHAASFPAQYAGLPFVPVEFSDPTVFVPDLGDEASWR